MHGMGFRVTCLVISTDIFFMIISTVRLVHQRQTIELALFFSQFQSFLRPSGI